MNNQAAVIINKALRHIGIPPEQLVLKRTKINLHSLQVWIQTDPQRSRHSREQDVVVPPELFIVFTNDEHLRLGDVKGSKFLRHCSP